MGAVVISSPDSSAESRRPTARRRRKPVACQAPRSTVGVLFAGRRHGATGRAVSAQGPWLHLALAAPIFWVAFPGTRLGATRSGCRSKCRGAVYRAHPLGAHAAPVRVRRRHKKRTNQRRIRAVIMWPSGEPRGSTRRRSRVEGAARGRARTVVYAADVAWAARAARGPSSWSARPASAAPCLEVPASARVLVSLLRLRSERQSGPV